jgi:3-phytase
MPNQKGLGILSTLDINTGDAVLVSVDTINNKLSEIIRYKPKKTALDALCLATTDYGFNLYTINVQGNISQLALTQGKDNNWQINGINELPLGPNAKSCAVSELTNSLYVTEENIGIWRYSTNPEHEIIRNLYQLPSDLEIEYVDTTVQGDVAVVSPDTNKVWLLDHQSDTFKPFDLADIEAPKTVQINRLDNQLSAFVFDDETGKNHHVKLQNITLPKPTKQSSIASLAAFAQTDPISSYSDAADDPEIWVNSAQPELSLVYGTDKKFGLDVYDLKGKKLTTLAVGRVNNVDIRYNINFNGEKVDIATASNRTNKSISVFKIDRNTGMPTLISNIPTDLSDTYGLCMGRQGQDLTVWINDTDGRFQGYELKFNNNKVTGTKVMEWQVPSQPEGCVVDDAGKRLFYGEEAAGVWLKTLDKETKDVLITSPHPDIEPDIEGMSLYQLNNKLYLVVSTQGNNRFAVYAVDDNHQYLGVFEVGYNWEKMIDGASETDGLAVTSAPLGESLPNGLLVVQDGHNVLPKTTQNFKLVDGSLLRNWILERINH